MDDKLEVFFSFISLELFVSDNIHYFCCKNFSIKDSIDVTIWTVDTKTGINLFGISYIMIMVLHSSMIALVETVF